MKDYDIVITKKYREDYDIVVNKKYRDYQDYDTPPYEYHLVVRDIEAKEDVARVVFAGPIWRSLFGEKAH